MSLKDELSHIALKLESKDLRDEAAAIQRAIAELMRLERFAYPEQTYLPKRSA